MFWNIYLYYKDVSLPKASSDYFNRELNAQELNRRDYVGLLRTKDAGKKRGWEMPELQNKPGTLYRKEVTVSCGKT